MKWKTSMWTQAYGVYFPYTLPAAVHLGLNFSENLGSTKYQPVKSVSQLFQVTWKMITDQTEITGITTIDRRQRMWRETTLLTDRQSCSVCNCKNRRLFWLSAKSGRYQHWTSHSMGQQDQMVFWKHVFCFSRKKTGSGRRGRMEFQWKNFPVFFKLGILDEIQKTMTTELKCEPQHFKESSTSSPTLCCVVKNGIWSCCNREEKN